MFDWNEQKRRTNLSKHGLDFVDLARFDFDTAAYVAQTEAGEHRYLAIGWFDGRLTALVFAEQGEDIRVISWRLATPRERSAWSEQA